MLHAVSITHWHRGFTHPLHVAAMSAMGQKRTLERRGRVEGRRALP